MGRKGRDDTVTGLTTVASQKLPVPLPPFTLSPPALAVAIHEEWKRERERAREQRRERGDPCSATAATLPLRSSAAATEIHHRHHRRSFSRHRRLSLGNNRRASGRRNHGLERRGLPLLLLLFRSFIINHHSYSASPSLSIISVLITTLKCKMGLFTYIQIKTIYTAAVSAKNWKWILAEDLS
ncbi:uncharacterized protein LOC110269235 [Arachis ipaensis]|uniref:uncharacterized protein LOC110265288 n=1 Tax=Arachis ipaensis TaxID=130454 RepID=UPI000A2B5556|nr:uncharacterized protein LOC110265288 [Arachis ipaensis]XP_020972592.1 uncharacterized protein LOC110269235 [Arachis ipaensis]